MNNLKKRWNITSNFQLIIIFIVFAINGSLSARISKYLMDYIGIDESMAWYFYYPILLILVLPLYPFMLIVFGYLFGQSKFFYPFSKKMINRMKLGFILNFFEK
ncbi:DUF6787 family protein [Flavobacterium macrobrachii]|uniref:Diacylglyceryl transferase n=1 Tax=Flavobacterium macrobrachii TaxID=591204 RepID=A0ABS2CY84_9FLAO|nr:DUF6787 family protein [Flavobacterium macrobrachii]MBM6499925.1 diacylglyceryl transferase [Flavobacterium macrobrachii]